MIFITGLLKEGRIQIEDQLADTNNRPIEAIVNFEVRYSSPENEDGSFDSPTVTKFIQQQQSKSIDEEQQMLLDIEQNIANLEKSINQGT